MKTSATKLSNHELHLETIAAAGTEKLATLALLEYLAEIDRRRLFSDRGFSSLWEYVVKALGYSEAQASDQVPVGGRVNAMRLSVKVPEVATELKNGKISLTSAAKLASHVRREKLTPEQTSNLLPKVAGKSAREVERVLLEDAANSSVQSGHPVLTKITLEVDADFIGLLDRVKELKGNPGSKPEELLSTAMKEYIQKREPKVPAPRSPEVQSVKTSEPKQNTDSKSSPEKSRYIPAKIRNDVRLRSGDRCEYVDSFTGMRCECRIGLEFDHFPIPFAMGGTHSVDNLKHSCPSHNFTNAIRSYGVEKMRQYL